MSRVGAGLQILMALMLWVGACPCLLGQRTAEKGWIISAVHPDPTPPLGAPDAEYVALHLLGWPGDSASLQGLQLAWNGHERSLDSGAFRPVGSTVVVHRAADSTAFSGWNPLRIPLSSWPALVNGGAVVELRDSSGHVLDALSYSESDLDGGGRPVLRRDPRGCGAPPNLKPWSVGESPFNATGDPVWGEGDRSDVHHSATFERVLPRGPGRLEWRLVGAADPVSRTAARAQVGGQPARLAWESDSVVCIEWDGRLSGSFPASGQPVVRIGPVRGCSPGAPWEHLNQPWLRLRSDGPVEPIRLLADPWPGDSEHPEEFVELVQNADHVVDPSHWDWEGGRLVRRRILEPGSPVRFGPADVQPWPGLRNEGGQWTVFKEWGEPAVSLSWGPCDHSQQATEGQGLPLERDPQRDATWHTEGHPVKDRPTAMVGHGCLRDWSGQLSGLVLHANRPVSLMKPRYARWVSGGTPSPWAPLKWSGGGPHEMAVFWDDTLVELLEWPTMQALEWGADTLQPEGVLSITCPAVPASGQVRVRVEEVLWHATDTAGEFVEVQNHSGFPIDLRGLQATTAGVVVPFPSDWRTWVDPATSLVLLPGEVMAFGQCPRWFAGPHGDAGLKAWPAASWSALPNEDGMLRIRLPSEGLAPMDSIAWRPDLRGPWWWAPEDWAWGRGEGSVLYPMPNRASPGRPNSQAVPVCSEDDIGIRVGDEGEWPVVEWSLAEAGHRLSVGVVTWPEGRLLLVHRPDAKAGTGRWVWDGLDASGAPARPGWVLLDVRWNGARCSGRKRHRVTVSGYGG